MFFQGHFQNAYILRYHLGLHAPTLRGTIFRKHEFLLRFIFSFSTDYQRVGVMAMHANRDLQTNSQTKNTRNT